MKKIFGIVGIIFLMSALVYGATIMFTDDDPIQYMTINTSGQTIPAGAELHLWVNENTGPASQFINVGTVPTGVEITIRKGATGLSGSNLYISYISSYKMYTRYQMYVSDLDSTVYGLTSDTVMVAVTGISLPAGEVISVTLDK